MGQVKFLFKYNQSIYGEYLASGKKYIYAKILYQNNKQIRDLVVSNSSSTKLKHSELIQILHHIDVWTKIWEEYDQKMTFKNNQVFQFENNVNFPTDIIDKIDF